MVKPSEWNCKERGECYLTYRRRIRREKEQAKQAIVINQSVKEWQDEYAEAQARQN